MSLMAWMSARIRILSRLIADNELDTEAVLQQLAFLLRVLHVAKDNTWCSVVKYDRTCRIMQASTKDEWHKEPDNVSHILKAKQSMGDTSHRSAGSAGQGFGPGVRKSDHNSSRPLDYTLWVVELCRHFNVSTCGFHPCKYEHLCNVCYGEHPAWIHHPRETQQPSRAFQQPAITTPAPPHPTPPPVAMPHRASPWQPPPSTISQAGWGKEAKNL